MADQPPRVRLRGRTVRRATVRYGPLVVIAAAVIALATALLLRTRADDRVEVRALVVAQRLDVTVDALGASVRPIFRFGGVAEDAVAEYGLPVPASALKGDLVDIVVASRTPVVRVVGRDADPTRASELANAVAQSLVVALNRADGIGRFALVEQADPARAGHPDSVAVLVPSIAAGVASMLVLYWLLVWGIRPIFTSEELAEVSTSPIVVMIGRSGPRNAEHLAEILGRRHRSWRIVDRDSHRAERLLDLIRQADPELEITAAGPERAGSVSRDRRDPPIVLVVSAGSSQGAVRRAEAQAGAQLAATVMLGAHG